MDSESREDEIEEIVSEYKPNENEESNEERVSEGRKKRMSVSTEDQGDDTMVGDDEPKGEEEVKRRRISNSVNQLYGTLNNLRNYYGPDVKESIRNAICKLTKVKE